MTKFDADCDKSDVGTSYEFAGSFEKIYEAMVDIMVEKKIDDAELKKHLIEQKEAFIKKQDDLLTNM